jgi:hypothetical protein
MTTPDLKLRRTWHDSGEPGLKFKENLSDWWASM